MPALGRCVSVLILVPMKYSKAKVALVSRRGFHTIGFKCTASTGASEDI